MILEESFRRLKRIILKRVFYEFDNFDKLCEPKAVKVQSNSLKFHNFVKLKS